MELIKSRLLIIFSIIAAVDSSLEDKKISFVEWVKIATKSISLYKVVRDFKAIVVAFQSLTLEEMDELTDFFSEEFDLKNDKVEEYIEQILGVLLQISSVVFYKETIRKPNALGIRSASGK